MNHNEFNYCKWCGRECQNNAVGGAFCPTQFKDWKDAAEFEARVALELLRPVTVTDGNSSCFYGNSYHCTCDCPSPYLSCKDTRLKWARLRAEKKMES